MFIMYKDASKFVNETLAQSSSKFYWLCINLSIKIVKKVGGQQVRSKIAILESQCCTGFNRLIICLTTVENVFNDLVLNNQFDFLLKYKISQDCLEIYFFAIRA